MADGPILLWFRRDLRLGDHAALTAAAQSGRAVLPVFIHDETTARLGAAPKYRLGLAIAALEASLQGLGARLILRQGDALEVLQGLIHETGAKAVYWSRYYEPAHIARDTRVKAALKAGGIEARSFAGSILFEPGSVLNGAGKPYAVFTPFWRAIRMRDPGAPLPAPAQLRAPSGWPRGDNLDDWHMSAAMQRGARVLRPHLRIGEDAALDRLAGFLAQDLPQYARARDFPARAGTSGLSENLAWGEISARQIWWAALNTGFGAPESGAEKFLSELGWREFAWHLMAHNPDLARKSWRAGWDGFGWRGDNADAESWRRGMTGITLVDAGMRELYVTGRMHNRVRMVVASYLTKHLLTDWRIGLGWFEDCLVDWDPAANAMGWQWVAGSGPDAAPYFRVFNPDLQAQRFDPDGSYRNRYIAEGQATPPPEALAYFDAVPRGWQLRPDQPCPKPRAALAEGREKALKALKAFNNQ
ncbi:MAG: deoxyribodipyrimidine photo-lyase [Albidovulum sp.]